MTIIKSYTSLEQSRKLAEILPPESADMCWTKYIDNGDITSFHATVNYGIVPIDYPCWSIAALSEFILSSVVDDDGNNYKFYLSKDDLDKWIAYYKNDNFSIHICEESDNMIDVILEMVCWLKAEKYI